MGFGDDRIQAAERLMQDFYRTARTVTRARANVLERLRPARRRTKPGATVDLGEGVRLFDGHVTIADSTQLDSDPTLALRTFAAPSGGKFRTHSSIRPISASARTFPSGIRGLRRPWRICTSTLCSGCPGSTALPWRLPPPKTESKVATENPLVRVLSAWHGRQLVASNGLMSRSKSGGLAAPGEALARRNAVITVRTLIGTATLPVEKRITTLTTASIS